MVNEPINHRISINRTGGTKVVRSVAVNTTRSGDGGGSDTLVGLTDVDASDADNGEVLVWNDVTQKYEVKVVPIIDGGSF